MKGAKGQGRILLIQDNFDEQLPNGLIKIDSIKSGVNDKLFESWEKSLSNNIRRGFNNIPQILIDEVQGKLGNSSGEAYKEAQRVFNRMTQEDRDLISEAFEMLLSYFDKSIIPAVGELEIIPFNILDEEELK
jgi:type I restriction-modification system DNA methylase subunit